MERSPRPEETPKPLTPAGNISVGPDGRPEDHPQATQSQKVQAAHGRRKKIDSSGSTRAISTVEWEFTVKGATPLPARPARHTRRNQYEKRRGMEAREIVNMAFDNRRASVRRVRAVGKFWENAIFVAS